jgi:Lecithin retinol acyltransferase
MGARYLCAINMNCRVWFHHQMREEHCQTDVEFPLGSHLITPRRGFLHHGIYVGGKSVVHYSGSTHSLHRGPVEEVSLEAFAGGRAVWIGGGARHRFDPCEVVRRARSRLGENHYRVFSNNCEHFCEWCLHGEHRSYQLEALLGGLLPLLLTVTIAIDAWLTLGPLPGTMQIIAEMKKWLRGARA